MEKHEIFMQKVESLEKELWALVKITLPELKDEIESMSGGASPELQSQVDHNSSEIERLASLVSLLQELTDGFKTIHDQLSDAQQELSAQQATLQSQQQTLASTQQTQGETISALATEQQNQAKSLSTLTSAQSQTQKSVDDLSSTVTEHGQNLTQITGQMSLFDSEISDVVQKNTDQDKLLSSLGDLQTQQGEQISAVESKAEGFSSSISTNASDIASLQFRVSELERNLSVIGGSGRTSTLIYDMESTDPALNRGFPDGICQDNRFNWEGDFDILKIYCCLGGTFAYQEFPIGHRQGNDVVFVNVANSGSVIHFFKIICNDKTKQFRVARSYSLSIDTSTGLSTWVQSTRNDYTVTRVEGIKGI